MRESRGEKGKNSHGANRFCVKSKNVVDLFFSQVSLLMVTRPALVFVAMARDTILYPACEDSLSLCPHSDNTLCKGHMVQ